MQYFREKLKMGVFDMIYVVTGVTINKRRPSNARFRFEIFS